MTQTKAHLLVITQDIAIKRLLLNPIDYRHIHAQIIDSLQLAAHFLQTQSLPDIIVLDLSLPDNQGLVFLQQLRARDKYSKLPVLVLTEIPDPVQVRAALQAGANRYLTKLFVAKNLLSTLDEMLIEPPLPSVMVAS